jgi:hypothetical protein
MLDCNGVLRFLFSPPSIMSRNEYGPFGLGLFDLNRSSRLSREPSRRDSSSRHDSNYLLPSSRYTHSTTSNRASGRRSSQSTYDSDYQLPKVSYGGTGSSSSSSTRPGLSRSGALSAKHEPSGLGWGDTNSRMDLRNPYSSIPDSRSSRRPSFIPDCTNSRAPCRSDRHDHGSSLDRSATTRARDSSSRARYSSPPVSAMSRSYSTRLSLTPPSPMSSFRDSGYGTPSLRHSRGDVGQSRASDYATKGIDLSSFDGWFSADR